MSLNRFSNKEEILDQRGLSKGILWKKDILKFLNLEQLPITPSFISTIEFLKSKI